VILAALPPHLRKALETMRGYVYQSEFARKYYFAGHDEGMAKGLEEGRSKGLEEGRSKGLEEGRSKGLEEGRSKGLEEGRSKGLEEGLEEGRLRGLRSAAMAMVRVKLSSLTAEDEAAVEAMNGEDALTRLIGELAHASNEAELRAALAAARDA
jgi:flagellar biosynthesis/type III secretory pathway protein FliH